MDRKQDMSMRKFGLIGKHIGYSFSRTYFNEKFKVEGLANTYENFDIESITQFPSIIKSTPKLRGLNVTIPYKEEVIPFLDKLNKKAQVIGAVNTIKVTKKGKLIGYNTDYFGFKKSIGPLLESHHKKALILGTGGASKAIVFALQQLGISYDFVSRTNSDSVAYTYDMLSEDIIRSYHIIINCTPLGTLPNISACPDIPYQAISKIHLLYDLVYNPPETQFLKQGKQQGATTCNGELMLKLQAEKAWRIWN